MRNPPGERQGGERPVLSSVGSFAEFSIPISMRRFLLLISLALAAGTLGGQPEVFEKIGRFGTGRSERRAGRRVGRFRQCGRRAVGRVESGQVLRMRAGEILQEARHARRHGRADRYVQSARTAIGRLPESLEGIRQYAGKNAHFDGARLGRDEVARRGFCSCA